MSKTHPLDLLPGYMSPKEAAKAIGCSVKTLSRRKLPALRHGNIVRYSQATIAEFIKQCTPADDKQQDEPPSTPSPERRAAKHIGSRAGSSLLSGVRVKSRRDQSNEALEFISELKAKESRSARSGTEKRKTCSQTLGEPSPSRELSKTT